MKKKVLLCLLFLMAITTHAQQAYVYRDSILIAAKGYTAKKANLESLQKDYAKEIQEANAKNQEKLATLIKPYTPKEGETLEQIKPRMSAIDVEKLNLLQEENKLLETKVKSYNTQLEKQYARDIKPILDTIDAVIAAYAKKNKIDFVYSIEELQKTLVYVNKGKDITKIIKELVQKEVK